MHATNIICDQETVLYFCSEEIYVFTKIEKYYFYKISKPMRYIL
jgi:hypothetical protein